MSRIAGGWEGRDTAAYLGKEGRRTSGERKFVELHSRVLAALASIRYRSGHLSLYRSTRGPLWCRALARRPKSAKPAKRAGRAGITSHRNVSAGAAKRSAHGPI